MSAVEFIEPLIQGVESALPTKYLRVGALDLKLQDSQILSKVTFDLDSNGVTTLIGPSGAGKSSLLRCLNGLYQNWQGQVEIENVDIKNWPGGGDALRSHVGLIAQKPCVFPVSIRANVVFGISGFRNRLRAHSIVEDSLRRAALWDEVKERLNQPARQLSIGQQQRLCIARAIAIKPKVLLLDEPTASLDPRSKQLIEQSLLELAEAIPVLCVTHDIEQAKRLGGQVIFMCNGKVKEQGPSEAFFAHPKHVESREFLCWNMCDCD